MKLVEPPLPGKAGTGRPRKTELRPEINALRYLVRSGCEWRMLPNDFPPYQTAYYWFRRLMQRFPSGICGRYLISMCNKRGS